MRISRTFVAVTGLCAASCSADTTLQRVSFDARAAGFERDATGPLAIHTPLGWDVTLTDVQVSIASLYFRNAPPDDGPVPYDGRAVAEVIGAFVVDVLDPQPHAIDGGGRGTTEPAMIGEVRFGPASSGPIARGGAHAVAYVAGTAVKGAVTVTFAGPIELGNATGESDYMSVVDRRLTRLPASFTARENGLLSVRVDPSHWFDQLSFDALGPDGAATRNFATTTSALQFRNGLASSLNAFQFTWQDTR